MIIKIPIKRFAINSFIKRLITAIILILIQSCKDSYTELNVHLENSIEKEFSRPYAVYDTLSSIESYLKVEEYLLLLGELSSTSKESYLNLHDSIVISTRAIKLDCLYKNVQHTQFNCIPSNVSNMFTRYSELGHSEKFSSFDKLSLAVDDFNLGYSFDLNDRDKIVQYLDAIQDNAFEKEFIFRLPLLALFQCQLEENNNRAKKEL